MSVIIDTAAFFFRPPALMQETLPRENDSRRAKWLREQTAKFLVSANVVGMASLADLAMLSLPFEESSGGSWIKAGLFVAGMSGMLTAGGMYGLAAWQAGKAHATEAASGVDCQAILPCLEVVTPPNRE